MKTVKGSAEREVSEFCFHLFLYYTSNEPYCHIRCVYFEL